MLVLLYEYNIYDIYNIVSCGFCVLQESMAEFVSTDKTAPRSGETAESPEPPKPVETAGGSTDPTDAPSGGTYVVPLLENRTVTWTVPLTDTEATSSFNAVVKDRNGNLPSSVTLAAKTCAKEWDKIAKCVMPGAIADYSDFDFKAAGLVNNINRQFEHCKNRLSQVQEWLADLVSAHGSLEACRDVVMSLQSQVVEAHAGLKVAEQKLEIMMLRFNQGPASRNAPSPEELSKHFRGTLKGCIKQLHSRSEQLRKSLLKPQTNQLRTQLRLWENQLRDLSRWAVAFVNITEKHPLAKLTFIQLDEELRKARSNGLEEAEISDDSAAAHEAALAILSKHVGREFAESVDKKNDQ